MFVLGNLIGAVATVLDVVLNALGIILIVNALLSWVRPDPSNPIVRFLDQVSDAVLDAINATGYGLTLGLHSRIDTTRRLVEARARAGAVYARQHRLGHAPQRLHREVHLAPPAHDQLRQLG